MFQIFLVKCLYLCEYINMYARVMFSLVFGFVCLECAVLSGKALFCRDPDSGKLHAVNTTWASMSFCGNYTCKLRRRNTTLNEHATLHQINITAVRQEDVNNTVTFELRTEPKVVPIIHKNKNSQIDNMIDIERTLKYYENKIVSNIKNEYKNTNNENRVVNSLKKDLPHNIKNIEDKSITDLNNDIIFKRYDIKKENGDVTNLKNHIHTQYNPNVKNNENKIDTYHKKVSYVDMKKNNEAKPQTTPVSFLKENETKTAQTHNIEDPRENSDRYLTEDEIKAITEILHSVKKSDLDAIVDIYNLAQDIYKEMDKAMSEDLINETLNSLNEEKLKYKPTSYWYDSIANKDSIAKMGDKFDMELQDSKNVKTTASSKGDAVYFNGAYLSKESAKFPYYYPITTFQRLASYNHVPNYQSYPTETTTPIKTGSKHNTGEKQKKYSDSEIQPSYLLPYPFAYVHQYNMTDLPKFYYSNPSWRVDYYNKYRYYQPYYNAFIAQAPNTLLYTSDEIEGIEQRPINKNELDKLQKKEPDWKTGPIPKKDIEEIRAKIDTSKVLAFPLRKLVKIDKVGKVSKVDDSQEYLLRNKRSPYDNKFNIGEDVNGDDGDYETYLEKVTCKPQTDLGFFKIGNMSQPFPQCCPQLIENKPNL